jgi:hypothetical protein
MKKLSLALLTVFGLGGALTVQARVITTPLPSLYGYLRYPIEYFQPKKDKDDCSWAWQVGGLAYARHGDKAYPNCEVKSTDCCDDDMVPYSTLVFGKSAFSFAEIFVDAAVPAATVNPNPFITIATVVPDFDYHEQGVIFSADVETNFSWCDTDYRVGFAARLPVRDIQVTDICGLSELIIDGEIADVYQQRNEVYGDDGVNGPTKTNYVYAARLDFLTELNRIAIPVQSLVNYANAVQANQITIAEQQVGAPVDLLNNPGIAVIGRTNGTMPTADVWGAPASQITGGTVASDGSGIANDARGRFVNTANFYNGATPRLENNVPAQKQLFVVPTLNGSAAGANENTISAGALNVQSAINSSISGLPTLQNFIDINGLNFCDGRTKGVGDLDLEVYFGRNWQYCDYDIWTDLKFTVQFPTSKKLCDCKELLKQPLGNDGHYEIWGGIAGGFDPCSRLKFMADLTVAKVLSHQEKVAAPFKGATVKNIGPCINADIDWWYLVGHADLTFFACDNCGFDVGYEIYHKGEDNIDLCVKTATDLLGNTDQPLDACVLSKYTNRTANKMRVGFFTMANDCEILGGWSYTFAGKNAPRDTDYYLSFTVNF